MENIPYYFDPIWWKIKLLPNHTYFIDSAPEWYQVRVFAGSKFCTFSDVDRFGLFRLSAINLSSLLCLRCILWIWTNTPNGQNNTSLKVFSPLIVLYSVHGLDARTHLSSPTYENPTYSLLFYEDRHLWWMVFISFNLETVGRVIAAVHHQSSTINLSNYTYFHYYYTKGIHLML